MCLSLVSVKDSCIEYISFSDCDMKELDSFGCLLGQIITLRFYN